MALAGKAQRPRREKNDAEKPVIARTAYDLQRLKLEKLMKNAVCNTDVLFVLSNLNSSLLRIPCSRCILYQGH